MRHLALIALICLLSVPARAEYPPPPDPDTAPAPAPDPDPDPAPAPAPAPGVDDPKPEARSPKPSAAPATDATALSGPDAVSILFTTDIYGRYAWPGCDKRPVPNRADMSHFITAVREAKRQIKADGEPEPVLLSAGSTIRPDVMGNHIFGGGAAWASAAVGLLAEAGFDAMAVGSYDFGAHPDNLKRYMELMRKSKIPLLAANLTCEQEEGDPPDFRCKGLGALDGKRYQLLERGGLKIGIYSVVREDLTSRILDRSRGSLEAADPLETARKLNKTLRQQLKADIVVLLANLNNEGDAPMPVIDFLRKLGPDAPDLVITDTLYDRRNEDYIGTIRSATLPPIVGTDRFAQNLGRARIHYARGPEGRVKVKGVEVTLRPAARSKPDKQAALKVADMMSELCRAISAPIKQAVVSEPMSLADFRVYLMEIMRTRQNAEVALLNDSAIADTPFPLQGPLNREMLLRAIRSETHMGYFKMDGATLIKKIALPYVVKGLPGLRVLGIAKKGKKYYINNRLINDNHHYKVATTAFVAGGGDGLVSLWTERFKDSGFALRRVAVDFFDEGNQGRVDGNPDVNLARDFADPWERWLLYSGIDLGVFFSNLNVDNGSEGNRYSKPMLGQADQTSLKIDAGVDLGASNRDHAVEVDVTLQYGHSWTLTASDKAAGKDSTSAEVLDQIRGDLLYRLTKFRNSESPGLWYMPVPYAEATLISEFTASGCTPYAECKDSVAGNEESYHYMELTGTVGGGLLVHPMLFFKLGFAVNGELLTPQEALAPGQEDEAEIGIYFGYKLRRLKLNKSKHYPIQLESRLDFYITDLGDTIRREVNWESKLFFNLLPMFYISASHRLYVFDIRGQDVSVANDISLGLEFITDYRYQLF